MKKLLIAATLLLITAISFIAPQNADAQNTCTCDLDSLSGLCQPNLTFLDCDTGFPPNCLYPACETYTPGQPNTCECRSNKLPTPTPLPTQPSSCGGTPNCCRCDGNNNPIPGEVHCIAPKVAKCRVTGCVCEEPAQDLTITPLPTYNMCAFSTDGQCESCVKANNVWTAIGCVSTSPVVFVGQILRLAIGLAGGIALLIMMYGVIILATSSGNPEKVAAAQQTIASAIAGLVLIIFSVVILNLIGVEILQIPGF